jgi:NAD(P)-dependent dehydrogenase (short-subunit alcohol dehydrogenase family)
MEAMSDTLRVELKPWNIRVIVVEPGGVLTCFSDTANNYLSRFKDAPSSAYHSYFNRPMATSGRGGSGFREAMCIGGLGSSPDSVARVIYRALTDRFPRSRYQATMDAWLVWPLLPLIPDWVKDVAIARMFGLHKSA